MSISAIRPIKADDNAPIADIIRQVMTEYAAVGPGYSINDPEVDQMYEAYQATTGGRYFVLEQEGRILGGGGFGPLANGSDKVCELRKMYFLPEARGQGWGRRMVELCLDAARELGYEQCYLETLERMESANVLYKKMGFKALCGRLGDTGHGGCDTYFAKDL